jgi:hypothetical protein
MGVTAQFLNLLLGDDRKMHLDKPFTFIYGGREYSPRSVVADIAHLFTNTRSFWYHRLNPLWGRPAAQIWEGRNFQGKRVDIEDIARDVLKSWVPIPAQGIVKENAGDTLVGSIINSVYQSIGITNYQYQSKAAKLVNKYATKIDRPKDELERHFTDLKYKAVDKLRKGKNWGDFPDSMKEELNKLSDAQLEQIDKEADSTLLATRFSRLSMGHKIEVWKAATPEERNDLEDKYNAAIERFTPSLTDEEYKRFSERIMQAEQ